MTFLMGLNGPREAIVLPELALTAADRNSEVIHNGAEGNVPAVGILIRVNLDSRVAPATFTPHLDWELADGSFLTIWTAAAAISADGDYTYYLHPDAANADFDEAVSLAIPADFRVGLTHAAGGSGTTLVEVCLMP